MVEKVGSQLEGSHGSGVVGRHSHEGQLWSPAACVRFQRNWEESCLQHMEMPFEQLGL